MSYPPPQPPGDWGAPPPGSGFPQGGGYEPQQPYPPEQPYPPQQGQDAYGQGPDPYGQQNPADPYAAPDPYGQAPMSGPPGSAPGYGPDPYGQAPMSGPPGVDQGWGAPVPPPKSGPPVWLFLVGGVVLLVLLGAGGFFAFQAFSGDEDDRASGDDVSASESQEEPQESQELEEEPESDEGYVMDTASRLQYPIMESWDEPTSYMMSGFTFTNGQWLETEPGWFAITMVGEIDVDETGYTDMDSAPDAAETIARQLEAEHYHAPGTEDELEGFDISEPTFEELSLAGTDAMMYTYDLTWDDSALSADGDRVAVGILDTGDGTAAGFLVTLPDNIDQTARDEAVAAIEQLSFAP